MKLRNVDIKNLDCKFLISCANCVLGRKNVFKVEIRSAAKLMSFMIASDNKLFVAVWAVVKAVIIVMIRLIGVEILFQNAVLI